MKNFIYLLVLATLILITSCQESEITEIDVTTEMPTEITGAFFSGNITDGTNVIPGSDIDVYQGGVLVGTVQSQNNGEFNTAGIDLALNSPVTFNVSKNDYVAYAKRIEQFDSANTDISIKLISEESATFIPEALENPGDEDLIVVSGYVTTSMNIPMAGVDIGMLYNIVEIDIDSFLWAIEGGVTETDDNGYYELLLPKDQEFFYFAYQNERCSPTIALMEEHTRILSDILPVEIIGPFTSSTELDELNNADDNNGDRVEFEYGFDFLVEGCNGEEIFFGDAEVEVKIGTDVRHYDFHIFSGVLVKDSSTFEICLDKENLGLPMEITVNAHDTQNNKESGELSFVFNEYFVDLGTVEVCEDIIVEPIQSDLNLQINGVAYEFDISLPNLPVNAEVINDTLFVPKNAFVTSANGFLNFSIPNLSGSELKIEGLRFVTTDGVAYNQETEEIVIGFPLMNNNRLIGFNITGHIVNKQTNQVEELTGNLAVSY